MDTQLTSAEAHHHRTIVRQAQEIESLQPVATQSLQQLGGVVRRPLDRERELGRIGPARATQSAQRSKHRVGPGANVLRSSDHTSVVISIFRGAMRITFADDGRPPRDRFDTVPAVEITVPFRVCST